MIINENVLQSEEKIIFALREMFFKNGYKPYRMSKFEEYDLYANNKDFLVSDNVITFTDTGGKLMALKPDVTLSIIKNGVDNPGETRKLFYDENVYRVSKGTESFKEIRQTGIECIGNVGEIELCEVLDIAKKSLELLGRDAVITISNIELLALLTEKFDLSADERKKLYHFISEKNFHGIESIGGKSAFTDKLLKLLNISGNINEALPELEEIFGNEQEYLKFKNVILRLKDSDIFRVDFSVTADINYYNGIVFKGFLRDIPEAVLSGGQYDRLMKKLGRKSSAVGFAVYMDSLERLNISESANDSDEYLNIALPKGRLGEKIYGLFEKAGFECEGILEPIRKLIFENEEKKLRFFWVKPSDVAIYVERGAADIGVAGKDILLEYSPDVYELLDLKKGKCKMAVAAKKGFTDDTMSLRVATKFTNIAKDFYRAKGRDIDIIHLNGSIEIAPILGLSDVIVDIVETGMTLKENDLEVIEDILPISARLIANKASYKFKQATIDKLREALKTVVEND